eukprot:438478_1
MNAQPMDTLPLLELMRKINQDAYEKGKSLFRRKFINGQWDAQPKVKKSLKELYDHNNFLFNNRYRKTVSPRQINFKKRPSDCIHQQYSSSTQMITFFINCITNTNVQYFNTHRKKIIFLMDKAHEFCLDCILEFAIKTKKFALIANRMNSISRRKICSSTVAQMITILMVLQKFLAHIRIIKLFCRKSKNVESIISFCKTLLCKKSILLITEIYGTSVENVRESYYRISSLLFVLFFSPALKRSHFKLIDQKFNFLRYLACVICSEPFSSQQLIIDHNDIDGDTMYSLDNGHFTQEFKTLFKIYKYKYPKLIKAKKMKEIILILQNWNCQTKWIGDALSKETTNQELADTFNECPLVPFKFTASDMEGQALKTLNRQIEYHKTNGSVCFNGKCEKYYKYDATPWNLKLCSGCKVVSYCSKQCQKYHWKYSHNKQCKLLRKHA